MILRLVLGLIQGSGGDEGRVLALGDGHSFGLHTYYRAAGLASSRRSRGNRSPGNARSHPSLATGVLGPGTSNAGLRARESSDSPHRERSPAVLGGHAGVFPVITRGGALRLTHSSRLVDAADQYTGSMRRRAIWPSMTSRQVGTQPRGIRVGRAADHRQVPLASIDNPQLASVVECPQSDNAAARQFAVRIMNAAREAERMAPSLPGRIEEAEQKVTVAVANNARTEAAQANLERIEADESLLEPMRRGTLEVDQARREIAALNGGPSLQDKVK